MDASRITKGALWQVSDIAAREIPSFIFFVILAQLLSTSDFGFVAIAASICLVAQVLVVNGMSDALVQLPGMNSSHFKSAFSANVVFGLVICFILLLSAWPLSWILNRPNFQYVFISLLPIILLSSASAPIIGLLRRAMDYKSLAIRTLIGTVLAGCVGISIAILDGGVWALVAQQLTFAIVALLVVLYKVTEKLVPFEWNTQSVNELRPVAIPVMLARATSTAAYRLDAFIVGLFMSDAQVGIYFMMSRLILTAQMLTQYSIGEVAFSALSRLQSEKIALENAIRRSLRLTAFFCLLVFGGLAVLADPFIPLLFGSKWAAVTKPLQIVAIFATFGALTWSLVQSLFAANQANLGSRILLIIAFVQLAAVTVSAPYGIQVIAIAIGLVQLLTFFPVLLISSKRLELLLTSIISDLLPIVGLGMTAIVISLKYVSHDSTIDTIYSVIGFSLFMIGLGCITFRQDIAKLRQS